MNSISTELETAEFRKLCVLDKAKCRKPYKDEAKI